MEKNYDMILDEYTEENSERRKFKMQSRIALNEAERILAGCKEHGIIYTDVGTFIISCGQFTDPYMVSRAAACFRDEINKLSMTGVPNGAGPTGKLR